MMSFLTKKQIYHINMLNDYEKQDIKMQNDEKQMSEFNIYFNKILKF